ncbi:hypothetical protein BH23CHL4_BH23CHL4_20640 [soil metagenome]
MTDSIAADHQHLFLSYASADRDRVLLMVDGLKQAGIPLWIDQAGIPGGANFGPEIVAAIKGCSALAVCCSAAAFASRNVRQEVAIAWKHERPILPLLFERVPIPDEFAYWLEAVQWLEVLDRSQDEWLPDVQRALAHFITLPAVGTPADQIGAAASSQVAPSGTLPAPPTPLIGRKSELPPLIALLRRPDIRLLTLTGPGGVGKTRLAIHIAAETAGAFLDGVGFVSLAAITNPNLVASSVAQALGVREVGEEPLVERLKAYLRPRQLLIVLDNFEQVVEAAPVVADLLAACPGVKVLVTSRVRLRVSGEREHAVPPLGVTELPEHAPFGDVAESEAVLLFVERAQAVKEGFVLTPENASDIATICRRLDGLPLAVELAAARVKILAPPALLTRLERRLPLLTGGGRDQPERLRTMRDAITWSYDLLSPDEQALFRRLAVFVGNCTLEAADAIGSATDGPMSDVLEGVSSLVDKSLLQQVEGPDGDSRYSMLQTVREYGLEQLDEREEIEGVRQRHASYFLSLIEKAEPKLRGRDQLAWLGDLEAGRANLRAALEWSIERGETETALRLAGALHWFWYLRGHWTEGRGWLEGALALPANGRARGARTRALAGAGILAFAQSDYPAARVQLQQSITMCREQRDLAGSAYAMHFLGMTALLPGDYAASRVLFEESVATFRLVGDSWGLAMSLCSLGVAVIQLEIDDPPLFFEESLALFRELGDRYGLAQALHYFGEAARARGDYSAARKLYEEGLTFYRALGHRNTAASVTHNLGYLAQQEGDLRRAASCFAESLAVHAEHGDQRNTGHCLGGLAGIIGLLGQPEQAARLFGAADAVILRAGASMFFVDRRDYDGNLAEVRTQLGEQTFAAAFAAGKTLPLDAALAEAAEVATAVSAEPVVSATARTCVPVSSQPEIE